MAESRTKAPNGAPALTSEGTNLAREVLSYAGPHLILEFWDTKRLDDKDYLERSVIDAVAASEGLLLYSHFHKFGDGGGISGFAMLKKGQITVHTWPERNYAAFDILMCDDGDPEKALNSLKESFIPGRVQKGVSNRGVDYPLELPADDQN